jgi:hypothetical protein
VVTYAQIVKAVNTKIEGQFPLIKMDSIDNKEGLKRPSFRTNIDNINVNNFMNIAKDRDMTIRIYYFPSNAEKYRIEILDMQDQLENLFLDDNIITTDNGFIIEIYDTQFDVVDGVLHFYIDIQLSEDFDRSVADGLAEKMEELDFEEELNN